MSILIAFFISKITIVDILVVEDSLIRVRSSGEVRERKIKCKYRYDHKSTKIIWTRSPFFVQKAGNLFWKQEKLCYFRENMDMLYLKAECYQLVYLCCKNQHQQNITCYANVGVSMHATYSKVLTFVSLCVGTYPLILISSRLVLELWYGQIESEAFARTRRNRTFGVQTKPIGQMFRMATMSTRLTPRKPFRERFRLPTVRSIRCILWWYTGRCSHMQ